MKLSEFIAYYLFTQEFKTITFVPGYGGTETFNHLNVFYNQKLKISFNEETAYSIAHGSALVGGRSAILTKSQGLMKAGNPVYDSLYTKITSAFLVLIFEDRTGYHSDNKMDILPVIQGMRMPFIYLDITNPIKSLNNSILLSEEKGLPVAVLIDSETIESEVNSNFSEISFISNSEDYNRDVLNHVVHPYFADYQYNNYIYRTTGGNKPESYELPSIDSILPNRYKKTAEIYKPLFEIFSKVKRDITTGDTSITSSFCLPPYNQIDLVTHIGGSVPLAIGAYLAGYKNVWAVSGDFGFIASGHISLLEAVLREIPLKIFIFNNKSASATGGQDIDSRALSLILKSYNNYLLEIDYQNLTVQTLQSISNENKLKIVILNIFN